MTHKKIQQKIHYVQTITFYTQHNKLYTFNTLYTLYTSGLTLRYTLPYLRLDLVVGQRAWDLSAFVV